MNLRPLFPLSSESPSAVQEGRLFEIFRCRALKARQVEGRADASRSLAW